MYCPLKFHNTLPMVPCEQKLMAFPFDPERFIKYSLNSLETVYYPSLLLPLDLGINVDLICTDIYDANASENLPLEDSELLYEPIKQKTKTKSTRDYTNSSGYLRKSTLPAGPIAYCRSSSVKEEKVDVDVEAEFDSSVLIPKINSGFQKKDFVHPSKPHLKADKVYNVLPDEHQISTEFIMFVYDEDPDDLNRKNALKEFADEEDSNLLSLYIENATEDNESNYSFLRNYKYSYLNDPNQNDILMWIDDETLTVSYCVVENKMQLKKKPIPKAKTGNTHLPDRNVSIKTRDEKKSELIIRKEKFVELGFAIEPGMETPVLQAMPDDLYDENNEVNNILTKLFGDDSDID